MISMDVSHPDIEDFIDVKQDLEKITKANLSVKVTDDFIEAVLLNETYTCEFIVEGHGEKITKTINARDLFMKLAENNHKMAEPKVWAI